MNKVLMIAPTPFFADRGCHVRILEEAKALQALGNEIIICTYHNGRDIADLDIRRITRVPWYNKLEAGPSNHKFYLDMLLLAKCVRTILQEKPDIIHAHLHEGMFIADWCRKFRWVPVLFDLQGSLSEELVAHKYIRKPGMAYGFARCVEKIINHRADAIISSSSRSAEELKRDFGIASDKIFVIPDGIDSDTYKPGRDGRLLRKKYDILPDKKVVVYVGILNKYQGIDHLLEAACHVIKKTDNAHFLIVGFPNVAKYESMAQSLGIGRYVTFTGKVNYDEVPDYLTCGDIAVTPKISETEGNLKVYSYMSSGLPTVAFDTPVNREILGNFGIYARPTDSNSLAEAIIRAVSNDELARDLSTKVREKAVKDYSWVSIGRRIQSVYELLIQKSVAFEQERVYRYRTSGEGWYSAD